MKTRINTYIRRGLPRGPRGTMNLPVLLVVLLLLSGGAALSVWLIRQQGVRPSVAVVISTVLFAGVAGAAAAYSRLTRKPEQGGRMKRRESSRR